MTMRNGLSKCLLLASLMGGASTVACLKPESFHPQPIPALQCEATRAECVEEQVMPDGTIGCKTYETVHSSSTICHGEKDKLDECTLSLCQSGRGHMPCEVTKAELSPTLPEIGTCDVVKVEGEQRYTYVEATQVFRNCYLSGDGSCHGLPQVTNEIAGCYILTEESAVQRLSVSGRDGTLKVKSLVNYSSLCPTANEFPSALTSYDVAPGPVGSAAGGGLTVPLRAARGNALVGQSCDAESCVDVLKNLRVRLDDTTVAGVALTNVLVTADQPTIVQQVPAPGGGTTTGFPAGSLGLFVRGRFNGVDSFYVATNSAPWRFDRTASALSFSGTLDIEDRTSTGAQLPITVTVSATATPSSPASKACALFTRSQRVLGLEDPVDWTTTTAGASVSLVTSPLTQGCGALGITGQGFISVAGDTFSTVGLNVKPAASVDLFIPTNQPNPYWIGAAQMFLTCVSGGVNNQYVGQVELTGKPVGAFSTLRFPLSTQVQANLRRGLTDCSFSFGLNVNQTGRKWILDNLRLTP